MMCPLLFSFHTIIGSLQPKFYILQALQKVPDQHPIFPEEAGGIDGQRKYTDDYTTIVAEMVLYYTTISSVIEN